MSTIRLKNNASRFPSFGWGLLALCSSFVLAAPQLNAGTFDDALSVCSSSKGHVLRLEILHEKGWHLIYPNTEFASAFGDAFAVSNQPQQNSTEAWQETRSWSSSLVLALLEKSVSIARNGSTLLAMGVQQNTNYSTCFLMTEHSVESQAFLDKLEQSGGVIRWEYGLRGSDYATVKEPDDYEFRTEIAIHAVTTQALPRTMSPLHPTLTATFVTRMLR